MGIEPTSYNSGFDSPGSQGQARLSDRIRILTRKLIRLTFSSVYAMVRPKDFVLTGIPRSGTSLLSSLLCEPEDCFCFNEIHFDVVTLPFFFMRMRKKLLAGELVPNRTSREGEVATDTQEKGVSVQEIGVAGKSRRLVLGSNVNILYLNQFDSMLSYKYKVLVVVRNPLFTLASWNSEKASAIPEARITGEDLNSRWKNVHFSSQDNLDRQAEIWEHYANLIWSLRDQVKIIRYEMLTENQHDVLEEITHYLGISSPGTLRKLRNLNIRSRYANLETVHHAVEKYCRSKKYFGY